MQKNILFRSNYNSKISPKIMHTLRSLLTGFNLFSLKYAAFHLFVQTDLLKPF